VEVNDAELWAIGLALWESVKKRDTLQTYGVTKVAIISYSQAAIQRTEHMEPGPGLPLARWINQSARRPQGRHSRRTHIHLGSK